DSPVRREAFNRNRGTQMKLTLAALITALFVGAGFSPSLIPADTATSARLQQPQSPKSDPPKKRKLNADLSGFDTDTKSDKKVSTMLGGTRATAVPSATLLAPKHAKFYGSSALFSWSFTGHSEGYVFLLTDEDETQLLRVPTKDQQYLFDSARTKLNAG